MAEGSQAAATESQSKSSAASGGRVMLWANPIPLECGMISSADKNSPRFSLNLIKKLQLYIRNKGKGGQPWLSDNRKMFARSYTIWQHIAKNKLHVTEEQAWLYFETFDAISDVGVADRLHMLDMVSKCSSKEELDMLHRKISVDMNKFMLFLYLQSAYRFSLRGPLVATEEWPSSEGDRRHRASPEYSHLNFIRSHLQDLLQLLLDPGVTGDVSVEGLKGLEFLLLAADKKDILPVSMIAQYPSETRSNRFDEATQTFPLPALEQWLRSRLLVNPYGSQGMKAGSRDKKCPCFKSESAGRIVVNSRVAPEGVQSALLHGVNRQTLAKGEGGLHSSVVHLQSCRGSHVYLLAPMKCVVIEKCSHCVIVLGAVERCVSLNHCTGICLVTACRRVMISSSTQCLLHLQTITPPLILANCRSITLAPYHTSYPRLLQHMATCGLAAVPNLWDKPVCVGEGASKAWKLMEPEDFFTMAVPFKMKKETQEAHLSLPSVYQEALEERHRRIEQWYADVRKASLSPRQKEQMQSAVQRRFEEWLKESGHKKEIYDLGRS